MNKQLSFNDLCQWIDNDEGLYRWWKASHVSKREFINQNRREIEDTILKYLNRKPRQTY